MNLHSYTQRQGTSLSDMGPLIDDANIAPSAPTNGMETAEGSRVSFRLRRRSAALGILNRGLANWYPTNSEELIWKDADEQIEMARKMELLMKNSHIFQKFKDRVAASEVFSSPMTTRMVLEDFLHYELLLVGKQGTIHRHSELIKHLGLAQRVHSPSSTVEESPRSRNHKITQECRDVVKCDSESVTESSDGSISEDSRDSPTWSPHPPEKVANLVPDSGSTSLHMPKLPLNESETDGTETFAILQ